METNFFSLISSLQAQGQWIIVIEQTAPDYQVVSVTYKGTCGDPAAKLIQPLIFRQSPAKIDNCFFADLKTPISLAADALTNMEQYLKSIESAKTASQKGKTTNSKDVPQKSIEERKYDMMLKKSEELEAERKFEEAWMKVPDPDEYPEHAEFLRKRRESLSAQFPANLFNTTS